MTHPDPAPPRSRATTALALMLPFGALCLAAGYVAADRGPEWLGHRRPVAAADPEPVGPPDATIDARLADIRARLATPPPATAPTPPPLAEAPDVAALEARLEHVERRQNAALTAAAAALAAATLNQSAQGSGGFTAALAAAERVLPPSPELRHLAVIAPEGAPSRAALAAGFPEAARRAVAARQAGVPGDGWTARIARALANVVTLRRLSSTDGDGVDAILARAQAQIADGRIETALEELEALPPDAKAAMADWTTRARRRADLDRHLASLRVKALEQLSAAAEPPQ